MISCRRGGIRTIAALIAARGGYGSVQLLPLLDAGVSAPPAEGFIGYSDNTSLLIWLMQVCGSCRSTAR